MGYASNAKVIWALKLLDKIGSLSKKYNLAEVYNNSEESRFDRDNFANPNSPNNNFTSLIAQDSAFLITENNFDSFCGSCISSKQTQIVIHKPMTEIKKNLEKIHVDL